MVLARVDRDVNRAKKQNQTAPKIFSQNATKSPSKVLFMTHQKNYTFRETDDLSNQIANYFTREGLKKGDDVALFMTSNPEFVTIWLGLAKAGIVSALLNNNQKLDSLAHSVNIVDAKAIIFDKANEEAIIEVMPLLKEKGVKYYMFGEGEAPAGSIPMHAALQQTSTDFKLVPTEFRDKLVHIYTSGTTGFPKAVIIKNSRYITVASGMKHILGMTDEDVLYTCLPLHHFAGGIMGTSQAIINGTTMAIRSKFSVSNYWEDCIKFKATVGQYIGELCRYLYAQPEKVTDKEHRLRVLFGNGMRSNLYQSFQSRFNIPWICEVYGTSEGNAQIVNLDGKAGSCGFVTRALPKFLMKWVYPVGLIKVNEDTGEPHRGPDGLCIRCEAGEVGMFVGTIDAKNPVRAFDGYSNKDATNKKIIHDVFMRGDAAFASGDLLLMDELGYCYFQDRTGDTFRWKGENVSTTEVESAIMKEFDADTVVYGVTIPGCEGRAGMAAIQAPAGVIDPKQLYERMNRILPDYSVPVVVRFVPLIETTATLKLPKTSLQKEAFNLAVVKDPVYILVKKEKTYQKLDPHDNTVHVHVHVHLLLSSIRSHFDHRISL